MEKEELVSVIMCFYNEPIRYVSKSVESVLAQTYKNLDIIFILDNPQNKIIYNFLKKIEQENNNIVLVVNESNLGLVKSLNKALQLTKGQYIARMDADDICAINRIEEQMKYLHKNFLDLVGCNIVDIDENDYPIKDTIYPENNNDIKEYLKYASAIAHPTWLVKKNVYDKLEGYRNIEACEDYDFLIRAALNNIQMGVIQKKLLMYRINTIGVSSTKKIQQKSNYYYIRNLYRKKKLFSIDEYKFYISSNECNKVTKRIKKFYALRKKYDLNKSCINAIKTILFSFSITLDNLYCMYRESQILKQNKGKN